MFITLYSIALPVFFVIDMLWLGLVAKKFYKSQIGSLMKNDINWIAAIIFYVIFIGGLVLFVILPAVQSASLSHALLFGAFFGFITYATYDLTDTPLSAPLFWKLNFIEILRLIVFWELFLQTM